jgi:hypothetical protein
VKTNRLKFPAIIAVFCVVLFAAFARGAWTTWAYGLRCNKCLRYRHVVEQRFFGIRFYSSSTEWTPGEPYARIFGQPCQHIVRGGGLGRSSHSLYGARVRCGLTADGSFFRTRIHAVTLTYELALRFDDTQLARDTFSIIDRLMPPDAQAARRKEIPPQAIDTLWQLVQYLDGVRTAADWKAVLQSARDDFRPKPHLPYD